MEVRNWLASASGQSGLPGGTSVADRYDRFQADLPGMCAAMQLVDSELVFVDLCGLVRLWLENKR